MATKIVVSAVKAIHPLPGLTPVLDDVRNAVASVDVLVAAKFKNIKISKKPIYYNGLFF